MRDALRELPPRGPCRREATRAPEQCHLGGDVSRSGSCRVVLTARERRRDGFAIVVSEDEVGLDTADSARRGPRVRPASPVNPQPLPVLGPEILLTRTTDFVPFIVLPRPSRVAARRR